MQQAYTGFFSGPDSVGLPIEVKAQKEEFEKAFLQMSTLATKLAEYQHTIGKALAEQKPLVTASTGPAVPGAAPAAGNNGGGENSPTGQAGEGSQAVEQVPLQAPPAAVAAATRPTSPDRGAGGQAEDITVSGLHESKTQKEKRATDCSHEELMQRRPTSKAARVEPADMEVEAVA